MRLGGPVAGIGLGVQAQVKLSSLPFTSCVSLGKSPSSCGPQFLVSSFVKIRVREASLHHIALPTTTPKSGYSGARSGPPGPQCAGYKEGRQVHAPSAQPGLGTLSLPPGYFHPNSGIQLHHEYTQQSYLSNTYN